MVWLIEDNLGGSILDHLSVLVHFCPKNGHFGLKTTIVLEISVIFSKIIGFPLDFLAMPGADLGETGSDLNLVEGENTPWSANRRASQAQLGSQTLPDPQETPPDPPRRVWINILFFYFFGQGSQAALATYSPSPAPASRERVTARNVLTLSYRYTVYTVYSKK